MIKDYHFKVFGDDIELGILTNDEQAIEAFKRDHPDWVQFPVEINLPRRPAAQDHTPPPRPRNRPLAQPPAWNAPKTQFELAVARPLTPDQIATMPSVAEVLAARKAECQAIAEVGRAGTPLSARDSGVLQTQFRRGGGGPTRMPGGGFQDLTMRQEFLLYRFQQALAEITRVEPNNPYRYGLREPNTPPDELEVLRLEGELAAARARAIDGVEPQANQPPQPSQGRIQFNDWDMPSPEQNDRDTRTDKPASTPVGRVGGQNDVAKGTNQSTVINGRIYGGHALDRMQERGITPTTVESVITNGLPRPGKRGNRTEYVGDQIRVILEANGDVVTVIPRSTK